MQDHTPESIPSKQCTKCKEWKPSTREYFFVNKKTKDGFQCHCKTCRSIHHNPEKKREYDKQRRANQRDKILEQKRAYYALNRERILEEQRRFRAENRESINQRKRELHRERYRSDPEYRQQHLARGKAWEENNKNKKREYYKKHSEREKTRARLWHIKNPERSKRKSRAWRIENPDRARELSRVKEHRRRTRKRNAEGTHTAEDVQQQYKRQKGRCFWCDIKVGDTYHVDHVIPLSRGGSNAPENIVVACPACNMQKHDKLPHEWPEGGRLL